MQNKLFPLMIYASSTVNGDLSLPLVVVHSSLNLPLHTIMSMCRMFIEIGSTELPGMRAGDIKLSSVHNNHLALFRFFVL